MLSRASKIQQLLLTAYGGLEKDAMAMRTTTPGGRELDIKMGDDSGDWVYILKLENLDESQNPPVQITDEDGNPEYNWYIGETNNIGRRWLQHRAVFYYDKKYQEQMSNNNYNKMESSVVREMNLLRKIVDDIDFAEDGFDLVATSCGSKWTRAHRPIEIFYLENLNLRRPDAPLSDWGSKEERKARRSLRVERERELTKMLYDLVGTRFVRGVSGGQCSVELAPWVSVKYPGAEPGSNHPENIQRALEGEYSDEMIDMAAGLSSFNTEVLEPAEDIYLRRKVKESLVRRPRRRSYEGSLIRQENFMSIIRRINDKYVDNIKEESLEEFVYNFISNELSTDTLWEVQRKPGRQWAHVRIPLIQELTRVILLSGFSEDTQEDLEALSYASITAFKKNPTNFLPCKYRIERNEWVNDQYEEKYTWTRERYREGMSEEEIYANQPSHSTTGQALEEAMGEKWMAKHRLQGYYSASPKFGKDTKITGGFSPSISLDPIVRTYSKKTYFRTIGEVRDYIKDVVLQPEKIIKGRIVHETDVMGEPCSHTVDPVVTDDMPEIERLKLDRKEAIRATDETRPYNERASLSLEEKAEAKLNKMKEIFSKDNVYGLCSGDRLSLRALHRKNAETFDTERGLEDFAFTFFKLYKGNHKLSDALISEFSVDTQRLMDSFTREWRRADIAEDDPEFKRPKVSKEKRQKAWRTSINGVRIVMNKVLNFYEEKRRELSRISRRNKEEFFKEVRSSAFFNILLDADDLERLYSDECNRVRRMHQFDTFVKEEPLAPVEQKEIEPDFEGIDSDEPLALEPTPEEDEEDVLDKLENLANYLNELNFKKEADKVDSIIKGSINV